jgi:hypothetical protein
MLMIDDEADQASVDTKGTEDPSTINKLILDILGQFPKGAYLAYTATPFANILSDPLYPNLLYPRDFIVDLPMPEGYFGTERIFGSEPLEQGAPASDGLPMIRTVPDEEVGQVKPPTRDSRDSFQPQLTNSLVDAMLWFLLSWGVRRARGQAGQHMSMLIHTTLYTDVHVRFESLLRQDLKQIQEKLLKGDVVLLQRIGSLWAEETAKIPAEGEAGASGVGPGRAACGTGRAAGGDRQCEERESPEFSRGRKHSDRGGRQHPEPGPDHRGAHGQLFCTGQPYV